MDDPVVIYITWMKEAYSARCSWDGVSFEAYGVEAEMAIEACLDWLRGRHKYTGKVTIEMTR